MTLTLFLLLKARPEWLALKRSERARIADAAFAAAFAGGGAILRHFDAEAFCARASDVAMLEAQDVRTCHFVIERLRDSPLFTAPYFDLVEIIPAVEDGFRAFEAAQAEGAGHAF